MFYGLEDLRIIDFSTTIAGSYTSKLLVDAGAEVIKVEPPQGDPLRGWSVTNMDLQGQDSALFQFLNTAKASVVGLPQDTDILAIIETADLVIETFAAGVIDELELTKRFPSLVLLSISPYGRGGPYTNRPATEFIVQAESGSMSARGLASQAPVMAGGRITEWVGGTFAAVAALAACQGARRTGQGEHIDFSLLEVMNIAGTSYADLMASLAGRPVIKGPARSVEVPSIEPSKDGWVGFTTNSYQQYSDFLVLIERQDLLAQKDLANIMGRTAKIDQWNEAVHAWTRQHSTEKIVEKAAALRIPVAPVNDGKMVLNHEHFKARGVFVCNPSGGFLQPRPPYLVDGEVPCQLRPAPGLGQHQQLIAQLLQQVKKNTSSSEQTTDLGDHEVTNLPLAGIRVLDATAWWAGPSATQMLAHLGAEVIHLEAIQRLDGMRMMGGRFMDKPQWWEYSAMFLAANTNKKGLTIDLDQPLGLALIKKLIAKCDVFVENYSPRVMAKFGLDWDTVHQLNPKTIMVRMPAFGLNGPWRDRVGFAQTMEQMTGLAWLTGHVNDQPRIQRGPCDPLAGMNAAFASLVALSNRQKTNKGCLVECAMVEGALNAAAEQIVEYSAYGNTMTRNGNRCPTAAPQGLYACLGHTVKNEQWLALSIETDRQWLALKQCLGNPAELDKTVFASHHGRLEGQDEIDEVLNSFFASQALEPMIETLVTVQIPAGRVVANSETSKHPQLLARRFYEELDHSVVGAHPFVTTPFTFCRVNQWLRKAAPTVGEDNVAVLTSVLDLSQAEVAELESQEVIGSTPKGLG